MKTDEFGNIMGSKRIKKLMDGTYAYEGEEMEATTSIRGLLASTTELMITLPKGFVKVFKVVTHFKWALEMHHGNFGWMLYQASIAHQIVYAVKSYSRPF